MNTHHINLLSDILFPLINFGIFGGVLFYALRKPTKEFVSRRSHEMERQMTEAKRLYEKEKDRYLEAEKKLKEVEEDKLRLTEMLQEEMKELEKRSDAALKNQIERIKQDGEQRVAEEIRKAVFTLKAQMIESVIIETKKELKQKMDPKKHQKLAEAYIEDIPADFEKFGKELDVSHNSTEIRQGAR